MPTPFYASSFDFIYQRIQRFLPNPHVVALAGVLFFGFFLIYFLADLLMPVFASIVIAYLLNGLIAKAEKRHISRSVAVYVVFSFFLGCLGFCIFLLMPMVFSQTVQLVHRIPEILNRVQLEIMRLPEMYPQLMSDIDSNKIIFSVQNEFLDFGQQIISGSASSFVSLVSATIYLFLVPLMVFFFLKDKTLLLDWFLVFTPKDRHLSTKVWREVDTQIANYVRGKFVEVFILWSVSYITFSSLDLNYAMLLAVLMGISVMIPYVGATLVTFPVLGVAYAQWGVSHDAFIYVVIAYSIIQALDGVVLVPLLFSEAVNLHPVAIIIAILFFGGLWGFWGVFFAIPLATVVKSVLNAWPTSTIAPPSN
ncbi:MAG: AI-2E family transporter [Methylococcales bacterium]|nr:AI-2E family transporter [Methylococcales bacterium]MCK5925682.1 AI-2E family transporter [Methylococcales bacterium]